MYDVIVVGARCAGSPTAMLLARKGHRVLVVDKASFPSETVSTHMISVAGSAQLKRWGLLEQIEASGCPPVTNIQLDLNFEDYGAFTLNGFPPPVDDGFAAIYAPKRTVLDKILIDAAAAAGAEVRERFTVHEILRDGDRVIGIRGRNQYGEMVADYAQLVVGADGMRSLVAKTVEAPVYNTAPSGTCGYYTYWNNVPITDLEFYTRPNRTIVAFPTNDQQAAIFVEWTHGEFHTFRANLEQNFVQTLDEIAPDLAARVRGGTRAHRYMGSGDLPNFFRKPYGQGWALVGDAGFHKDPITAQGITDAFRDAEFLAAAIDQGLAGIQSMEAALAGYEQRRNETIMPLYEFICDRATLAPFPSEFQQVLAALRGHQADIDQFFGVIQNTIPFREFFSPHNLMRILNQGTLEVTVH
ncbi:NAD(P)/FAD-dependent oxidoreductase [Herpetosiphon giganteus]|uniref:NAD(P)/FAD-dependent oxidoreductase n=1 Tax=Herpetosiphon giganteus TaxID=2029754 RepID=UPI00195B4120|nr:NAD(P)/FAD-dependent oxidoreductase [Herpetosiphon giganteus]MBM7845197.1 flavin-dependent dehydrogenase [Herpetosiphon giganteus]